MTETTCIQHGTWGIECGPACKEMTDQWNAMEPELAATSSNEE